jgi:hypothetical protein
MSNEQNITIDLDNDRIYEIHPANLEALKAKIAKMQNRARRLKSNPISLENLGEKTITVTREAPGGKTVECEETRILLRVHGLTPKLAGWSLVAKVEWLGEERLLSCVPGETCPERYRTGSFFCDHCKTDRRRKEVFILRNGDRHVQVGRSCLKDFLGGKSPEDLLAAAEWIFRMDAEVGICEGFGGSYVPTSADTLYYLSCVAICIRRLGWLSKGMAGPNAASTSSDAWELAMPPINASARRSHEIWVEQKKLHYQDRDKAQAEAALEWARALPTTDVGDYIYSLGVACRAGYVTYKTMGLVASAISAHLRHLDREKELQQRQFEDATKSREWVGEIKKREVFEKLTVKRLTYIDGQWGVTTLVHFEDRLGNQIKWFASKELDLHEGDVVDIKATVKAHSEYKNVKQTIVNRAVILKTHEVPA